MTYPLNTDGIDIQAYNVTIYNINMTNYDDAFVPKPCRSDWKYCQCSGQCVEDDDFMPVASVTSLSCYSFVNETTSHCKHRVSDTEVHAYTATAFLYRALIHEKTHVIIITCCPFLSIIHFSALSPQSSLLYPLSSLLRKHYRIRQQCVVQHRPGHWFSPSQ